MTRLYINVCSELQVTPQYVKGLALFMLCCQCFPAQTIQFFIVYVLYKWLIEVLTCSVISPLTIMLTMRTCSIARNAYVDDSLGHKSLDFDAIHGS